MNRFKLTQPDAGLNGDVRFVTKMTVSFIDVQFKVTSFGNVFHFFPIDSILHFELDDGLASSSTDHVDVTPDIVDLNRIFVYQT